MKDVRDSNPGAAATREVLQKQFIARSLDEIDQMRRCVPQLIKGDAATWQEVRFGAQRLAASATSLELGVLAACAQELAGLADEKFAGAQLDEHFLLSVTSGIEMLAIELSRLASELSRSATP